MIFLRNSSPVIGDENMPKVPSVALLWPSADVVAQQSVSVIVLKPVCRGRHTRAGCDEAPRPPPVPTASRYARDKRYNFGRRAVPFS